MKYIELHKIKNTGEYEKLGRYVLKEDFSEAFFEGPDSELIKNIERFGIEDLESENTEIKNIFPKDGLKFLKSLKSMSSVYLVVTDIMEN